MRIQRRQNTQLSPAVDESGCLVLALVLMFSDTSFTFSYLWREFDSRLQTPPEVVEKRATARRAKSISSIIEIVQADRSVCVAQTKPNLTLIFLMLGRRDYSYWL